MPLESGKSRKVKEDNFRELRQGKTYAKTRKKSGAAKANAQMVAIVLNKAGESKPGDSSKSKKKGK
jgi:hypothetical protein